MTETPFLTAVSLCGALLGLALASAVGAARPRLPSHRMLAALLAASALMVAVIPLTHAPSLAAAHRPLELIETSVWVLAGPAFYLYIHLATGGRAAGALWLHFLPGAAWLAWLVAGLAAGRPRLPPPVLALMIYQAFYTALGIQRLVDRWSRDRPAGIHRFWCRAFTAVLVVQHLAQLVRYLFRDLPALREVVPLTGSISFLVLAFLGIRRSPLAGGGPAARRRARRRSPRAAKIAERLDRAMEEEGLYRDGDLTLDLLAERLEVPRDRLSRAVNDHFGHGLVDYLNGYRVREAQRLLAGEAGERLTVEAIAHRSGFNSRSAFYEAFRRQTGTTPADYRESSRRGTGAAREG